jgi:hypothetical protein
LRVLSKARDESSPLAQRFFPPWVNLSIFSGDASEVELLLFERKDGA